MRHSLRQNHPLTLRRKSFFLISITLAALVILLYNGSRLILLRSIYQLEERAVITDTERVTKFIGDDLDQLGRTTTDWAHWDATSEFVRGLYDEYVTDNLGVDTLVNLGLNFVIYQDRDGAVHFSRFIDLAEEAEAAPAFPLNADFLRSVAPDPDDLLGGRSGIVKLDGQPMLVVSRHILNNQSEGPSAGTLIFGAYLDEARIAARQETLNSEFSLYDVEDPALPTAWQEIVASLDNSGGVAVQPVDSDSVAGYQVLADVSGEPAYLLKVDLPRTLYSQGLATLRYFVVNLLFFGLMVIFVTLLLMDRLVLARLARLHTDVTQIKQTGDLSLAVEASGTDEIAGLGQVLNDLLGEVERSREQLQSFNRELERRVAKRTAALAEVNRDLRAEVSEREKAQAKLATARDQAMEALRLKAQILANVSHDVRTPLNVIMLRSEMLLREQAGPVEPKQKKLLETILFSARELLHFFNNLLEQSQTQHKMLKIARASFSPRELIHEVDTLMLPLAERKGLSYQSKVSAEVPAVLNGDRERLKQILNNLIDNAIKYTEAGEVRVQLALCGGDKWAMLVSDSGRGISEEDKDHIFEAFWQADGTLTRTVNRGVGLGLSIVKQLSHSMGGELSVAANGRGKGSTFVVRLPLLNGASGESRADE